MPSVTSVLRPSSNALENVSREKMAIRKRFIAGAKCPACQAQDSMAMWRENNIDIVECVKCGHQMREADKEARDHVRKDEQVIGIFHPD